MRYDNRRYIIVDRTNLRALLTDQLRGSTRELTRNNKPIFLETSVNTLSTYEFTDQPGKTFTVLKWRSDFGVPDGLDGYSSTSRNPYTKILTHSEILSHLSNFAIIPAI